MLLTSKRFLVLPHELDHLGDGVPDHGDLQDLNDYQGVLY